MKKFFSGNLGFVLLLGFISLFTDMTYEAARSITGPFLALLGASGAVVGIVAGLGELIGYGLRFLSGYLVDHTKKYWLIVFIGYFINLLSIPLLAFAGNWPFAAGLIILERIGKAIRSPARDAMLSHATQEMGVGWGFGIHKSLDQVGSVLGPIIIILILFFNGTYRQGFAYLFIPAAIAIGIIFFTKTLYPSPRDLEPTHSDLTTKNIPSIFWIFLIGCGLIAAGYADFPLIAFHFEKESIVTPIWIPIFYAIAMGVGALFSLILGRFYDKKGMNILIIASIITLPFSPLVFLGKFTSALIGILLWGVGAIIQHSLMKAIIAQMITKKKRGSAYGIFDAGFGFAWFLGSSAMGILYDHSILGLVIFSIGIQLLALPFLLIVKNKKNRRFQ